MFPLCLQFLSVLTFTHNLTFLMRLKWKLNFSLEVGHADSDSNWQEIKTEQRHSVKKSHQGHQLVIKQVEWERNTGLLLTMQQWQLHYLIIPLHFHVLQPPTPTHMLLSKSLFYNYHAIAFLISPRYSLSSCSLWQLSYSFTITCTCLCDFSLPQHVNTSCVICGS